MALCNQCGAYLEEGVKICKVCGSPAGSANPVQTASQRSDSYAAMDGIRSASRRGGLRLFSVLFAIGFLIASFGIGLNLYFTRQVEDYVDKYAEEALTTENMSESELREYLQKALVPWLKGDAKNWMKAVHFYSENETENEERINALPAEDLRFFEEQISEARKERIEKHGIRYTLLIISTYSLIIICAGGGLAFIALCAWLALGGFSGPASQTMVRPVVILFIILGILMIVAGWQVIPTIDGEL